MAPFGGRVGLKLDADEVPPFLALHADFNSLQLDTLLDEVLHDFNLVRSPPEPGETGTSYRIVAEPRHAYTPQLIRRVVLEIDNESHVVRKAIIARGTPRTLFATTTYMLVDSQVQDDETYHLDGHLKVTAEVYTRDHHPERRNELMGRFFGPGVEKRMRPPIPKP